MLGLAATFRALHGNFKPGYFGPVLSRHFSKKVAKTKDINTIRNIGLIAHVDAGKTTTCERLLFHTHFSDRCGNVDSGDTVMDYLDMERERGITINAAAITAKWKHPGSHYINIIDTPGHVDFTIEVERSVRVLDGAVTIIDAVAGVQAQTEKVWNQASSYGVPMVVYINKMDRDGASFTSSISSLESRLYTKCYPVQMPVGIGKNFREVVDLISMEDEYEWSMTRSPITDRNLTTRANQARQALIEAVAEEDEEILKLVIASNSDGLDIPANDLKRALRNISLNRKGVVVLCGSSLKNKGIHPVLDAIVDYLPSPAEKPLIPALTKDNEVLIKPDPQGPLVALAFKVVHDRKKGLITYLRIYSGKLAQAQKLLNTNEDKSERPMQIFRIMAEDMEQLTEVAAGDIAAVIGLKHTKTGDTLVGDRDPKVQLRGLSIPHPVFFSSIVPENPSYEESLKESLSLLQLEDPSVSVVMNTETGQQLICGQGELHMEVIKDRLLTHYKAKATIGETYIAYRSTIENPIEQKFSKTFGKDTVQIHLKLQPSTDPEPRNKFQIDEDFSLKKLFPSNPKLATEIGESLKEGASDAFSNGFPSGFPFHDLHVTLCGFEASSGANFNTIRNAMFQAIMKLASQANPIVLEPIMSISVQVDETQLKNVLSDLTGRRRGEIEDLSQEKHLKLVKGRAPLKELLGYASDLRSMTKGTGFFSMEFLDYASLPPKLQQTILQEHGYFH